MNGAKKVSFDTARSYPQHVRYLFGGPLIDVAQSEHFLLAVRQLLKSTPDAMPPFLG